MSHSDLALPALVLTVAALAFAAGPAPAADNPRAPRYGPWVQSVIGGGGYIQNVAPTADPLVYYAWVDVAGVFRTDDGGRSWRCVTGAITGRGPGVNSCRGVSADPRDPERLVAALGTQWAPVEGLFISGDGGRTWTLAQEAAFFGNETARYAGAVLARHPDRPDHVFAASAGTMYRSRDGGRTWSAFGPEGLFPTHVAIAPDDPDRLWVCASPAELWVGGREQRAFAGGLFRSDDGGETFVELADEAPSEFVFDRRDAGTLYGLFGGGKSVRRSTDGGASWAEAGNGLPLDGTGGGYTSDRVSQALGTGPDATHLVTSNGSFYRLPAGGERWEAVPVDRVDRRWWWGGVPGREGYIHFGKAAGSITADPHTTDRLWMTDWYAIWRSDDGGRSWAYAADGVEVTVIHTLAGDPARPELVHLGMADNGYLRSTDGGATFERAEIPGVSNAKLLAAAPGDPSRLYATANGEGHGWSAAAVYASRDRGRTWSRVAGAGLPALGDAHRCNSLAIDPANPDRVALGVSGSAPGGGVYLTDDAGATWSRAADGWPDGPFFKHDIWVVGPELAWGGDGTLLAMKQGGELWRRDAGSGRWERIEGVSGGPNAVVADAANPGRFYAATTRSGLWRSDDGGRRWSLVLDRPTYHVAIDPAGRRVAAGTDDGVALSTDGGATFAMLDQTYPNRPRPVLAFAGDRLVIGTPGNGVFWIDLDATAQGR